MWNSLPLMMLGDRDLDWSKKLAIFEISESSLRVKVILRPSRQLCPPRNFTSPWLFHCQIRKWTNLSDITRKWQLHRVFEKVLIKLVVDVFLFWTSQIELIFALCIWKLSQFAAYSAAATRFSIFAQTIACRKWDSDFLKNWPSLVNRERSFW